MAKNLSTVNATTTREGTEVNKPNVLLLVFDSIFSTRSAIYKGWTSNPIPRSEITRLRSNVFKGFGNDGVILSA